MTLKDNEKMEEDVDDLFDKKDLRTRKEKKRNHKQTRDKEDIAKESFKKMKEEIDELRKRELDRQKELDELKKKIEEQTCQQKQSTRSRIPEPVYTLGFDKETYLKKGFIESAKWIRETLAKNMIEKMTQEKNFNRFEPLLIARKKSAYLGARACARFNRGEECQQGRWHTTLKHGRQDPDPGMRPSNQGRDDQGSKKAELRLHACTLCLEALGAAFGHTVLDCPWIQKKNWCEDK